MKIYKATYGTSMLLFITNFLVCSMPVILFLCFVIPMEGEYTFWQMLWMLPSAFVAGISSYLVIFVLVNLIIKPFSKNIVEINDNEINYKGKKISLHKVKFLTLYLPKLSRTSSKPQELVIWIDSVSNISIKRPSFFLIHRLKKECKDAKFVIENLKSEIKSMLIIGLIVTAIFAVALFMGLK